MPDPEPVDGGPTRAAVDWHELAKHAPDVDDDERSMPAVADRKVLRRRGPLTLALLEQTHALPDGPQLLDVPLSGELAATHNLSGADAWPDTPT